MVSGREMGFICLNDIIRMQPNQQPSPDPDFSQKLELIIKQILSEHIYKHPSMISSGPQFESSAPREYNIKYLKSCMVQDEQLSKADLLELIAKFDNIIKYEENMVKINGNVMVVGDIHGQFYDFVKILGIIGTYYGGVEEFCQNQSLLFLGDYVDRGLYSIEVMTLIMALKVNYPKSVFCLRGNHECRTMTAVYNFKAEVLVKYDQEVYDKFMQTFDMLPIACLINNSYFCVHGGISDQLLKIEKINQINRFQEIPDDGPFCDFMWADPMPKENEDLHEDSQYNNVRMCSIFFGKDLTNKFIEANHLKFVIRAHEVFPQGFQRKNWNPKSRSCPSIITIFSAPNYCRIYNNLGAILHIKDNNFEIRQYKEETLTKFQGNIQVFQWSIPEIIRVINEFTKNMLHALGKVYLKDFEDFQTTSHDQRLKVLLGYYDKYVRKPGDPKSVASQSPTKQTEHAEEHQITQRKQIDGNVLKTQLMLVRSKSTADSPKPGLQLKKASSIQFELSSNRQTKSRDRL